MLVSSNTFSTCDAGKGRKYLGLMMSIMGIQMITVANKNMEILKSCSCDEKGAKLPLIPAMEA